MHFPHIPSVIIPFPRVGVRSLRPGPRHPSGEQERPSLSHSFQTGHYRQASMQLETHHACALVVCLLTPFCNAQDTSAAQSKDQPPPSSPAPAPAPATPLPTPAINGAAEGCAAGHDRRREVPVSRSTESSAVWAYSRAPVPGDESAQGALSNGQIFLQKADRMVAILRSGGSVRYPVLGTPFISTERPLSDLYGPVPVAYLKLAPGKNTSI